MFLSPSFRLLSYQIEIDNFMTYKSIFIILFNLATCKTNFLRKIHLYILNKQSCSQQGFYGIIAIECTREPWKTKSSKALPSDYTQEEVSMADLLLIDDDIDVLEINRKYLTGEGFTVHTADTPQKGIALAKKLNPSCIVLDVMMPGMDGFEVCRQIRTFSAAPIIFLTGKSSEDDKITGLLTGADDYLVKPYGLRELTARIQALLRRASMQVAPVPDTNVLTFRDLTIDKLAHKAFYKGEDLGLANREYEVLLYLATHPNQDVTFEELGTALFGVYSEEDRRSVMVNVSRLRKKMTIDYPLENMIETVWSKGYRFISK